MKFVMRIDHVGTVAQLDDLIKNYGYAPHEVALVTDSQDVQAVYDYFGVTGKREGLQDFGGFFVVVKDGDYTHVWAFFGNVPGDHKALYEVKWRLVDEQEWKWLKDKFRNEPKQQCTFCNGTAIDHYRRLADEHYRRMGLTWQYVCMNGEKK